MGEFQGEAVTIDPDSSEPTISKTHLKIEQKCNNQIENNYHLAIVRSLLMLNLGGLFSYFKIVICPDKSYSYLMAVLVIVP